MAQEVRLSREASVMCPATVEFTDDGQVLKAFKVNSLNVLGHGSVLSSLELQRFKDPKTKNQLRCTTKVTSNGL